MKRLDWKYLPIAALFSLSTALAPVFHAQDGNTVTRLRMDPPDAFYNVDGVTYSAATGAVWTPGSRHVITAVSPQSPPGKPKTRYIFQEWDFGGDSTIHVNPIAVSASAQIPEYLGRFQVLYALSLVFFDCPDPSNCASPGTILVNDVPYTYTQDIYFGSGSQVVLQAFPNPGWVFVGWAGANGQLITGLQNKVTMSQQTEVYPKFSPARHINLATSPAGLQVLADRAPVITPVTMDWAMSTTHSLGPVSPQQDKNGKLYCFQSWSDQGAVNHAYAVGTANSSDTVTATYVPCAAVTLLTQPNGLPLKVDGFMTTLLPLNPSYFTWGVGEKHKIEAPAQQTDSQGRVWKFVSWSNGAPAAQDITVPLDADVTGGMRITATYVQMGKLTVNSPLSSLSVQIDGADCATPCQVLGDLGQRVKVSTPASIAQGDSSRLDFMGWPGGSLTDYTVTLGEIAQSLNAAYRTMNRFTATSDPAKGAAWRVDPASNDGYYGTDAVVAVSLTAQPGYKFRRWDGDLSGTIPSGTVAMNSPRNVRALLDPVPYIAPAGVTNAAGATPSPIVAPGSIVSIFGANLATGQAAAGDGMLPQTLGGVTARVGDRLLPLVFASPEQINAVLPNDLPEGQQLLTVSPPAQPEVRTLFTVARNAPGLFGTVFHEDGSVVSGDSPARVGELLTVYGTGFGPTDHQILDGFPIPASPDYLVADPVEGHVGDASVQVVKASAAAGKIGINLVQFKLNDGATSGPLKITVNGVDSNTITLPVQ